MTYNLYLDDMRNPRESAGYMPVGQKAIYLMADWVVVRDYDDFCSYIRKHGLPNLVSFDHDLADEHYHNMPELPTDAVEEYHGSAYVEKTGYECAKWLTDYCMNERLPLCQYLIHSMNPVGSKNIRALLENFKKHQKIA